MDTDKIIDYLFLIVEELDARNSSNNCVLSGLEHKSWTELCEDGIRFFEQIK